ncbi:hypothetical protein [Paraburkholderia phosphatilytica]|uniref:hypothetical protein n=1 Tax=Paraburkholderia phosphatilytica TaxID=2282883 RepID=UPI000E4F2B3A|nr:hypothetical protein [Paraburkholderia phosphatilytica]
MPLNGFTVGRDLAVNIQTSTGPMSLSLITKFTARPETTDVKVKGLDGRTRHLIFPDGWAGSFEVERQDATIDTFIALQEANYYAGMNLEASTITETITEVDGSVSQFIYTGVIFKLDDAGDWAGDATVKQKLAFVAETRVQLS